MARAPQNFTNQKHQLKNKMKFIKRNRFTARLLLFAVAIIGILIACTLPARADIYSTRADAFTNSAAVSGTNGPFYLNASTNLFTTIAAGATLTVTSDPIPVRQGAGLVLLPRFVGTNASGVENVTNIFDVGVLVGGSSGTTNWTTAHPLTTVSVLNGATAVIDWNVFDNTEINNVAFIRWREVDVQAGHTNIVTILPPLLSKSLYAQ
jgi:hypothetical protein